MTQKKKDLGDLHAHLGPELKKEFKVHCAKLGKEMAPVVRGLVVNFIQCSKRVNVKDG